MYHYLVTALSLIASVSSQSQAKPRPNIIFLMADDLGFGDVGFNGNQIIQTPNLDALAKRGLRLDRFYAASAVCSPTRGSALTGRHPIRLAIPNANSGHLRAKEQTLAELLRDAGYRTGHFGKWHLGTLTKTVKDANRGGPRGKDHYSTPQGNGFELCFSTESKVPTFDPLLKPEGKIRRTWWQPLEAGEIGRSYGTAYWDQDGNAVTDNTRGDDSRVIMDRVIPFVRSAVKDEQPFFAVVWFHAPHLPVVADREHRLRYKEHSEYEQHYYGCITALDEQVGRLRAELVAQKIAGDTLIWFCSDNGPEGKATAPGSAGQYRGRKRSLYEGGVRVPAFVVWPGHILAGRHSSVPAVTSDYLPTIAAILELDLAANRERDGVDLSPLLRGEMKKRGSAIGFEYGRQATWVDDRWKLYQRLPKRAAKRQVARSIELYDLVADPTESKNLASAHPDVVERMKQELEKWRGRCRLER